MREESYRPNPTAESQAVALLEIIMRIAFFSPLTVSLLFPATCALAADAPPAPEQVRGAVHKSLAYLEQETLRWKETRKCASCHHAPMMVWSLSEARNKGYAVHAKALADVAHWSWAPAVPIVTAGTAWATLGLVRYWPEAPPAGVAARP